MNVKICSCQKCTNIKNFPSKILLNKTCLRHVYKSSAKNTKSSKKFLSFWINIYLFYCYSVLFLAKMVCNNISTHSLLFCIRIPTKHCTLMVFINYRSRTVSIFQQQFFPLKIFLFLFLFLTSERGDTFT